MPSPKLHFWTAAILGSALALSAAARAKPVPVEPEARSLTLGGSEVVALKDADNVVENDGKTFGLGRSPAEVAALLSQSGAPTAQITLAVDALLVKAEGRTFLFDTGLGPGARGVLLASLAKAGVRPEDVTDVFITHSHGDHVGGLRASEGGLAFPRAVVHMSTREWAFLQSQPKNAALVQAISPKVKTFEPGVEIAPGVKAVALYGHTPGHVGYEITVGGTRLLDMGDVAHSAIISLARPDWAIGYDADAEAGRQTRLEELAHLARTGELVFGPHMPFPGVGRIVAVGGGYEWRPAFR